MQPGEGLKSEEADAFISYYLQEKNGAGINPFHFDGCHTHIQLWALVNTAGPSLAPDFLQNNGHAGESVLEFYSCQFAQFLRITRSLRGESIENIKNHGLASGALLLVNYGDKWAKANGILNIHKTTPKDASSICVSPIASKAKAEAKATALLDLLSALRPKSSATIMADFELAELSKKIDWEAENKKSQREQLMSRVWPS